MSAGNEPQDRGTVDHVLRMEQLCDRYEDELRTVRRTTVDEFLRAVGIEPSTAPSDLFRELATLRDAYPRGPGADPSARTVRRREREPVHPNSPPDAETAVHHGLPAGDSTAPGASSVAPAETSNLRVAGRYRLLDEIGRGGMGVVYRAHEPSLGREVAVKVLSDRYCGDPTAKIRFLAEARVTGRLQHPGVPPVFEVGTLADGSPFLAMKVIEGQTLAALLTGPDRAGAAPGTHLAVFEHVCQAVGFAHSKGVIHRDLKPANVMVGAFGEVQVMDWGLAKVLTEPRDDGEPEPVAASAPNPSFDQTWPGTVVGTPAFLAPEQARGEAVDRRADVFGLGAVLCAILTGKAPFVGQDVMTTLRLAASGEVGRAFSSLDGCGADPELVALCKQCLHPGASERPTDAGAVAALVSAYRLGVEERLRAAEREQAATHARAAEGRKRRVAQTLLAAVAAGAAGLAVLWWLADTARGVAVAAREGEASARESAETARDELKHSRDTEAKARAAAESARDELKRLRDDLARVEYGRTMRLAYQAWLDNDLATARRLLNATRPELRGWEWRYVHRLCHADLVTLRPHAPNGSLTSFRFSPDGSRVLTIDHADREPRIRDSRTGNDLLTLRGHTGDVWTAVFSADGTRVLTASADGTARVWDAKTGAEKVVIRDAAGSRRWAEFAPGGRVVIRTLGQGGRITARLWDSVTGDEVTTLKEHLARGTLQALSSDGGWALMIRADRMVFVVDARTGAEGAALRGLIAVPNFAAAFSPDGDRILTTNFDKAARIWDAKTGTEVAVLGGHPANFVGATFSPDDGRVLTHSGTVARVWDGKAGGEVVELKGHASVVSWVAFDPAGGRVGTASMDGTARVWDAKSGAELLVIRDVNYTPVGSNWAEFSPDGGRLLTRRKTGAVCIWDARAGVEERLLTGDEPGVGAAGFIATGFSPDGVRAVFATRNGRVCIRDIRTGADVVNLAGAVPGLRWAAFSPDGSRLLTTAFGDTVRLWDARTGAEVAAFKADGPKAGSSAGAVGGPAAAFSPDGARLVVVDDMTTARIRDARTGVVTATLRGHTSRIASAAYSPDGGRVVTAGWDGTVRVWDAASGAEVRAFTAPTGRVEPLSPQARAALSFHEGQLRLRQEVDSRFWSAAFSPDGGRVVTAGGDGAARVWDIRTGAEVAVLAGGCHHCDP